MRQRLDESRLTTSSMEVGALANFFIGRQAAIGVGFGASDLLIVSRPVFDRVVRAGRRNAIPSVTMAVRFTDRLKTNATLARKIKRSSSDVACLVC